MDTRNQERSKVVEQELLVKLCEAHDISDMDVPLDDHVPLLTANQARVISDNKQLFVVLDRIVKYARDSDVRHYICYHLSGDTEDTLRSLGYSVFYGPEKGRYVVSWEK